MSWTKDLYPRSTRNFYNSTRQESKNKLLRKKKELKYILQSILYEKVPNINHRSIIITLKAGYHYELQ